MPLPAEDKVWPPIEWSPAFDQFASNDAWYGGNESDLVNLYAGSAGATAQRGDNPASHFNNRTPDNASRGARVWRSLTKPFWGRARDVSAGTGTVESKSRLHSPLAGNLATLSSDILFSDAPNVQLILNGDPIKGDAQDRCDLLFNGDAFRMTVTQAAEWAAGISGAVLTAHWDPTTSDHPWMQASAVDAAIPEYVGAKTVAVNLWSTYQELSASGQVRKVFYHVERHEIGAIVHALYEGQFTSIGKRVPLNALEQTAHILDIFGAQQNPDNTVTLPTGIDKLTAQVWRNLPTRQFRRHSTLSRVGRSDFEGVEALLSAVDEVWSSWMRDVKIARARLIVPAQFLEGSALGPQFDDDREILTALDYADTKVGDTIEAHQFEIRYQEHQATILALITEILQHAGYSNSSYGEADAGSSKTATEVVDRTTATERTRDKKILYYRQAQIPLNEAMLDLDRVHYHQPGLPDGAEVRIEFTELSQIDPEKQARTMGLLRNATAASTKTLVAMLHPDWDEEERAKEVERILNESGMSDEPAEPAADPALIGRVDPLTGLPIEDPANPDAPSLADPRSTDPAATVPGA